MSKYYFTSTDLISSIKRRANVPDSQDMITDEEILDFANEEMQMEMIPLVMSKHEDYFLVQETVPVVEGTSRYDIPYRSIANKLREVAFSTSDANGEQFREMYRISPDDITNDGYSNSRQFYIESDQLVLSAQDSEVRTGFLKMWYWLRPNTLVDESRMAVITSIDTTNGIVIVDNVPDHFTTGFEYDIIKTRSPHRILGFDLGVSDVNPTTKAITFTSADDLPAVLRVGDRIGIAGETDLINLPSELHPMLAQTVAARILEELGDKDNLATANKKLEKMETRVGNLIDNRVVGSPYKVKNRNGFLRNSRKRRNNL